MKKFEYPSESVVKMEPLDDEVVIIKEEILSDEEQELLSDGYFECVESSEMPVSVDIEEGDDSSKAGAKEGTLMLNKSALGQYFLVCKDAEDIPTLLYLVNKSEEKKKNKKKDVWSASEDADNTKVVQGGKLVWKDSGDVKSKSSSKVVWNPSNPQKTNNYETSQHKFKCSECDESFELRSCLVMHELGHEKYKKYSKGKLPTFSRQLNCEECDAVFESRVELVMHRITHEGSSRLYSCNECNATFELKSRLRMHEVSHQNQNKVCLCKGDTEIKSDLCKCFVRTCETCGSKYFAVIKLGNWNICMKCHLRRQQSDAIKSSRKMYSNLEPTVITHNIKTSADKQTEFHVITGVKRICYSCGKLCSGAVSKIGTSWLCYTCYNTKYSKRNGEASCVYCSRLFPYKSLSSHHKCLHKPLLSKDDQVGQHFLSPADPAKQRPKSDWNSLFDDSESGDDDNDDQGNDDMVIDATQVLEEDGDDAREVMLCDKTGELIHLSSDDQK